MKPYIRPKPLLSKYRRRKLALERSLQRFEEYCAKKEAPPEPARKEHKRTKKDPKDQKRYYHRPDEKTWRAQDDLDYYTPTQQEMTRILTVAEALALLDRMGET